MHRRRFLEATLALGGMAAVERWPALAAAEYMEYQGTGWTVG